MLLFAGASFNRAYAQYYVEGHWDFNNITGSTLPDISGNGHNGTIYNCTSDTDCQGRPDQTLHFGGANSWVSVPASSAFCMDEWTINIVFKPDDFNTDVNPSTTVAQWSTLLSHGARNSSSYYSVEFSDGPNDNNPFSATWTTASGTQSVCGWATGPNPPMTSINGYPVRNGKWYCLTVVNRPNSSGSHTIEVYINGYLVSSYLWGSTFSTPCPLTDLLQFGRGSIFGRDTWFTGNIDDITIYRNAIDRSDVRDYFSCPCPTEGSGDSCGVFDDIMFRGSINNPTVRLINPSVSPNPGLTTKWFVNSAAVGGSMPSYFTGTQTYTPGINTMYMWVLKNPSLDDDDYCDYREFDICIADINTDSSAGNPNGCSIDDITFTSLYSAPYSTDFFAQVTPSSNYVTWSVNGTVVSSLPSTSTFSYTFSAGGGYKICATAYDPSTGITCDERCFDWCISDMGYKPASTSVVGAFNSNIEVGQAYPNPAEDAINIPIKNFRGIAGVRVCSADGKLWNKGSYTIDAGKNGLRVSTAGLPSGIYFIELNTGNAETIRRKFSKR